MTKSLTDLEKDVRAKVWAGEQYDSGWRFDIDPEDGEKIVACLGDRHGPLEDAPQVSAEFVRDLLLTCESAADSQARGVRLWGLRIAGKLALDFARGTSDLRLPALEMYHCYFEEKISAQNIEIAKLDFWGSVLPGVEAAFTHVAGPFGLFDAILTGERPAVELAWAKIEGAVGLSDMRCTKAAVCIELSIFQADIRGELSVENSSQRSEGEPVPIKITLFDSCTKGTVNLKRNHISSLSGKNLDCTGSVELFESHLVHAPGDKLNNMIDLERARIQGTLICQSMTSTEEACGINLESSRIGFLNARQSVIHGGVQMIGAEIAEADFEGATLVANGRGPKRVFALYARSVRIIDNLRLRDMTTMGSLRLPHAKIGGDLELNGSEIKEAVGLTYPENLPRWSIDLTSAEIGGSLLLGSKLGRDAAILEEGLCLDLAEVTRDVDLTGTRLGTNEDDFAASLYDTNIGGKLRVRNLASPTRNSLIDLRECRCGLLDDEGGDAWRGSNTRSKNAPRFSLRLDGFCYDRFQADGSKRALWKSRKRWLAMELRREDDKKVFFPQPYDQLIRTLKLEGRDNEARKAMIGKRIAMRNQGDTNFFNRQISRVYHQTFGYGCSPGRALFTLVAYWGIGAFALSLAEGADMIQNLDTGAPCGKNYSNIVHALQLMVPLPNLLESGCTIDPALYWAKILEILYALVGAIILALTVLTFSGIARNEMNK